MRRIVLVTLNAGCVGMLVHVESYGMAATVFCLFLAALVDR